MLGLKNLVIQHGLIFFFSVQNCAFNLGAWMGLIQAFLPSITLFT